MRITSEVLDKIEDKLWENLEELLRSKPFNCTDK